MKNNQVILYDLEIHKKLIDGSGALEVSLDSGTAGTFARIKGVNAFDKVISNLSAYSANRKGLLRLKYIFLPGTNDNDNDIEGFIALCRKFRADRVILTSNQKLGYGDYNNKTMRDALRLMITMLENDQINHEIYDKHIIGKL